MFKMAVVGPLAVSGIGVARACIACYRAHEPHGAWACSGFGPGCLALKQKNAAASDAATGYRIGPGFEIKK